MERLSLRARVMLNYRGSALAHLLIVLTQDVMWGSTALWGTIFPAFAPVKADQV